MPDETEIKEVGRGLEEVGYGGGSRRRMAVVEVPKGVTPPLALLIIADLFPAVRAVAGAVDGDGGGGGMLFCRIFFGHGGCFCGRGFASNLALFNGTFDDALLLLLLLPLLVVLETFCGLLIWAALAAVARTETEETAGPTAADAADDFGLTIGMDIGRVLGGREVRNGGPQRPVFSWRPW